MRTFSVVLFVIVATLITLASLASGITGLMGRGGVANVEGAVPALITGLLSAIAVVGYVLRRRWWIVFAGLGLVGHIVGHAMLLSRAGTVTGGRVIGLFVVPVLWLIVVAAMLLLDRGRNVASGTIS